MDIFPTNTLKVTINPDMKTQLVIAGWPINTQPALMSRDEERVDVERDGRNYSIVFDDNGAARLEIWTITPHGELGKLTQKLYLK